MKIDRLIIIIGLLYLGVTSCKKETEIELGPVYPMAGEWWVTVQFDDGVNGVGHWYGDDYFHFMTANTAANTSDELLIDDFDFWESRVKANLNLSARTFSVTDAPDLNYALDDPLPDPYPTVTITNGQVIVGGGTSIGGNQTDSIYMEVTYSDDTDGYTYIISGHKRTGFLEDEP